LCLTQKKILPLFLHQESKQLNKAPYYKRLFQSFFHK